jgi:predicted RNA-binding Zn ribbon-like protein
MRSRYPGPLRAEPIAVELHNTLYAAGGEAIDGLGDRSSASAFIRAIAPRLAHDELPSGDWPTAAELVRLRERVRLALRATVDDTRYDPDALTFLNHTAALAPTSPRVQLGNAGAPVAVTDHHRANRAEIVLAAFAADTIALITGPLRGDLRACDAPGCILVYVKDHPRRQWCSNACGNRVRQARHYRRTREAR